MEITIRELKSEDKEQILKLLRDFGNYFVFIDPLKRCVVGENYSEYFYNRMLSKTIKNQGVILCALQNNNVVGFIAGLIKSTSGSDLVETIPATFGYVLEFYVDGKFRSQGVGQRLMQEIEQYFVNKKCDYIHVDVFAPNTKGLNFYRKFGFIDRDYHLMKLLKK